MKESRFMYGVSPSEKRRFAKIPPPIEVLRLNFRTADMTAKRGKRIKKAAFCMLFEVF